MILRSYRKQTIILLLPLLANCSTFYLQRYQERKQRSDLDRSIEFAQETLQDMEDNSPKVLEYIDHLGFVLGLRYNSTYSMEDLATMELAWQRALANSPDDSARSKYLYILLMSFPISLKQEIPLAEQKTIVNVEAVALIKVRTDEPDDSSEVIEQLQSNNQLTRAELLLALNTNNAQQNVLRAVELFLDKSEAERAELIRLVIEGHLRGLIRQRTFDELVKESEVITDEMFRTTRGDLNRMGLELVSFTLQEIYR